jgi:hypothetical protein
MMSEANALSIGNNLGDLLEVDNVDSSKPCKKSYLQLRVQIKLLKSLLPGFIYQHPLKDPTWI